MSDESFDFLIVGAGSAGCALAARLSEDPSVTVCLVEAGGLDNHLFIRTPALVAAALARPRLNWRFETEPQKALADRRLPVPRGRVLGGSSSLNGMVYQRGHPLDYEDWAQGGARGWGYSEVLPYFTRSENNENYPPSVYHGSGGPLNVRYAERPNPMGRDYIEAVTNLGYPRCNDFTGARPEGVGQRQATIRKGLRHSASAAFLHPAMGRRNLRVVTDTQVSRLLLEGRRAIGVEVVKDGEKSRILARREVILCAGAIQSPQLLMLSGIGDGRALQDMAIDVVHDLPGVGRNFHDHPATSVAHATKSTAPYGLSFRALPQAVKALFDYAFLKRGPLSSNLFEMVAFLRTRPELDRPDFQFTFQPANRPPPSFPFPVGHGYAVSCVLLYPRSRGQIALKSPDYRDAPLIDPAMLSDTQDVRDLVRGVRIARQILASSTFEKYRGVEVVPGVGFETDDRLEAYVRSSTATVYHPAGSCRMGIDSRTCVVDPQLRVFGIEGLRVADASVFPHVPGGNTNAPTIMIAEKAADLIKGREPPAPVVLDLNDVVLTGR